MATSTFTETAHDVGSPTALDFRLSNVANPMTRQDLVGNIKAIAESALLFAESGAGERLADSCERCNTNTIGRLR